MNNILLAKNTINQNDVNKLIEWLHTNPKLTKGDLTLEFEKKWSEWIGKKYSVFVNSGSSANLAAIYALLLSNRLRNKKIVVPAISWITTISPAIQFGMEPIMCDADPNNLGLDINHLKTIIKEHDPAAIILVHVLGFPNHMKEIKELCETNNILLIEDTCESLGSLYQNKKLGTLSDMSTFSFYFGHHISTIEGGMVCTDDEELADILIAIRSHGWDRDLSPEKQKSLRSQYNIENFNALYTFYYPGLNIRSTDLQAFIGLGQLEKLDHIVDIRNKIYKLYQDNIKNEEWKINPDSNSFISNFAYPIITEKRDKLAENMAKKGIECRPLISGSMAEQPFWYSRYGKTDLPFAKTVHLKGMYIPNNQDMSIEEVEKVISVINNTL
jgi:CDP-6-deoxy-D-xylo-4-hexulose-3-dehydrase